MRKHTYIHFFMGVECQSFQLCTLLYIPRSVGESNCCKATTLMWEKLKVHLELGLKKGFGFLCSKGHDAICEQVKFSGVFGFSLRSVWYSPETLTFYITEFQVC